MPWYKDPTAQVICDCVTFDGEPIEYAPRAVLKRVLKLYEARNWRPVVAPELEFFLAAKNLDPDYPLQPPAGKTGRPQTGRQAYGIDAVNEFDPLFEDIYDYCEAQEIGIDSLIHEEGVAQVEMNFNHGDPHRTGRPDLPVQAHRAPDRDPPRHVCDLHGQALRSRTGLGDAHPSEHRRCQDRQKSVRQPRRQGLQAFPLPYRGAAESICRRRCR